MRTAFAFLFVALTSTAGGQHRVIEEQAIPFTGFLSKAEFDQRYPGELVEELSELSPGWYVIYEHEALSYYFGPMLLESTGEDYLAQLTGIVEEAVEARPTIRDYRLELSYEPSQVVSSSEASQHRPNDASVGQESTQPEAKPSLWSFFKRLFGF
jgi:hypothetical protein